MIEYLNLNIVSQYGIDKTFKITSESLKPFKLMIIYVVDKENNTNKIAVLYVTNIQITIV